MSKNSKARDRRRLFIGTFIFEVALASFEGAIGQMIWILPAVISLIYSVLIVGQTLAIRRPDYDAIAEMEKDIYGETYYHDRIEK
jgi:hypothetical protein